MRRVILFDLDDTLISEDQYIRSGYRAVGKYLRDKFKISSGGDKRLYELYEEDSGYVFNRYLEELKIDYDKELILELVRVYREHKPDIDFFPDVIPALESLRDLGAKMGIISDGYTITQRRKLEALKDKLYFFDKIILTDELGRDYWKPDERSFVMMMEAFLADWKDMVYVGDNPKKDFYIGKERDIATIRVHREKAVYEKADYMEGVAEDLSIKSFDRLADEIKLL